MQIQPVLYSLILGCASSMAVEVDSPFNERPPRLPIDDLPDFDPVLIVRSMVVTKKPNPDEAENLHLDYKPIFDSPVEFGESPQGIKIQKYRKRREDPNEQARLKKIPFKDLEVDEGIQAIRKSLERTEGKYPKRKSMRSKRPGTKWDERDMPIRPWDEENDRDEKPIAPWIQKIRSSKKSQKQGKNGRRRRAIRINNTEDKRRGIGDNATLVRPWRPKPGRDENKNGPFSGTCKNPTSGFEVLGVLPQKKSIEVPRKVYSTRYGGGRGRIPSDLEGMPNYEKNEGMNNSGPKHKEGDSCRFTRNVRRIVTKWRRRFAREPLFNQIAIALSITAVFTLQVLVVSKMISLFRGKPSYELVNGEEVVCGCCGSRERCRRSRRTQSLTSFDEKF